MYIQIHSISYYDHSYSFNQSTMYSESTIKMINDIFLSSDICPKKYILLSKRLHTYYFARIHILCMYKYKFRVYCLIAYISHGIGMNLSCISTDNHTVHTFIHVGSDHLTVADKCKRVRYLLYIL